MRTLRIRTFGPVDGHCELENSAIYSATGNNSHNMRLQWDSLLVKRLHIVHRPLPTRIQHPYSSKNQCCSKHDEP